MHIISLVEKDFVSELEGNAPDSLSGVSFHPSIEGPGADDLPACIVVAAAEEKIAHNHTYEVTVTIDLHTQADDMMPDDARAFSKELAKHLTSDAFFTGIKDRADDWLPFYLRLKGFDAIDAEDRRYVHRVQLMLMAQA